MNFDNYMNFTNIYNTYICNEHQNINSLLKTPFEYYNYSSSEDHVFFKIMIPYRDRLSNLITFLKSIRAQKTVVPFKVVIIEHNSEPTIKDVCKDFQCEYIFIKLNENMNEPQGHFNKSLCFDTGFLHSVKGDYCILHDVDIPVHQNYIQKLFENLHSNNFPIFYRESNRVVYYLNEELSKLVRNDITLLDTLESKVSEENSSKALGSPGGCSIISSKLYLHIGGHDADLFWGFAPEDELFLYKVGICTPSQNYENPNNVYYHLYHTHMGDKNNFLYSMQTITAYLKMYVDHLSQRLLYKREKMTEIINLKN